VQTNILRKTNNELVNVKINLNIANVTLKMVDEKK
jgi:hypothetical protein